MNISQMTNTEILNIVEKYVDLSSIDCSVSELNDEAASLRDAGETIEGIIRAFADLAGESQNLPDRFMVDLIMG